MRLKLKCLWPEGGSGYRRWPQHRVSPALCTSADIPSWFFFFFFWLKLSLKYYALLEFILPWVTEMILEAYEIGRKSVDFYIFIVESLLLNKIWLARVSCMSFVVWVVLLVRARGATFSASPTLTCAGVFRDPVHRAAHQPRGRDRGDPHGPSLRIWCCQLPLHVHVLLSQVRSILSLFFFPIPWIPMSYHATIINT